MWQFCKVERCSLYCIRVHAATSRLNSSSQSLWIQQQALATISSVRFVVAFLGAHWVAVLLWVLTDSGSRSDVQFSERQSVPCGGGNSTPSMLKSASSVVTSHHTDRDARAHAHRHIYNIYIYIYLNHYIYIYTFDMYVYIYTHM